MFSDRLTPWTDRLTVTIKPTWICNLRCHYCYQGAARPTRVKSFMSADILEASIRAASKLPVNTVDFQWIGGETLAPGIKFYEQALRLTEKYATATSPRILHWFQTNLTLIDEKWIAFLKEYRDQTILSVSYDFFEDYFLKTQQNNLRTAKHQWTKIQRALDLLREHDIQFGCLTTIDQNALKISPSDWLASWVDQGIKRIGLQLDYNDVYSFQSAAEGRRPWEKYNKFVEGIFVEQNIYNNNNKEERLIPVLPVIQNVDDKADKFG